MKKLINNLFRCIQIDPNCTHGSQHFSGIFKNGKLMYIGNNHLRNSYNNECVCFSTHAEMDVLHKVLKDHLIRSFKEFINLNKYSIVVVRIGRDGNIKNSRPCNQCLETMCKYRIKKVIYSTEESFEICKPENMNLCHVSSGWSAFITGRLFKKKNVEQLNEVPPKVDPIFYKIEKHKTNE
jgi:hypothetical protein